MTQFFRALRARENICLFDDLPLEIKQFELIDIDTDTVNFKVELRHRTFDALLDNIIGYLLSYEDPL